MRASLAEMYPSLVIGGLAQHFWDNRYRPLADILRELGSTSDFGPGDEIAAALRTAMGRSTGHPPAPGFRYSMGACAAKALDPRRYSPAEESDAEDAATFAMNVHAAQYRRHTGEPYWLHLAQVAGLVKAFNGGPAAIAAAWLHDVLEDQPHAMASLLNTYAAEITDAVVALSDLETGNRKARKAAARERLAKQEGWIQTIKICDLISNAPSIKTFEPEFWATCFKPEAELMLDVLTKADPRAVALLRSILAAA